MLNQRSIVRIPVGIPLRTQVFLATSNDSAIESQFRFNLVSSRVVHLASGFCYPVWSPMIYRLLHMLQRNTAHVYLQLEHCGKFCIELAPTLSYRMAVFTNRLRCYGSSWEVRHPGLLNCIRISKT
jgi:hypothetical protein